MLENRFFRLLFYVGYSLILIGALLLYGTFKPSWGTSGDCDAFLILAIVLGIVFNLIYDFLNLTIFDNLFGSILRWIIFGAAIIAIMVFTNLSMFSNCAKIAETPFVTRWLSISNYIAPYLVLVAYQFIGTQGVDYEFSTFAPLACVIASYILGIPFAFMFLAFPALPMIVVLAAFVIGFIILIVIGGPALAFGDVNMPETEDLLAKHAAKHPKTKSSYSFSSRSSSYPQTGSYKTDSTPSRDEETLSPVESTDTRSTSLCNEVEVAAYHIAETVPDYSYVSRYGKVDIKVRANVGSNYVDYDVEFHLVSHNDELDSDGYLFQDDLESKFNEIRRNLIRETESRIGSIQRKFKGYDEDYRVNATLSVY